MYLYGRETEKASSPVNVSRSKTPYLSFSTNTACEQALRSLFWPPAARAPQRACWQAVVRRRKVAYFVYFFFLFAFLEKGLFDRACSSE